MKKYAFTYSELKSIFIAGMDRENENINIDMGELEEEDREVLDFGDFLEKNFDITE